MADVYDFSFAHGSVTPELLVRAGAAGAIGYVGADPAKCITRREVDGFHAAGIPVATVHERTVSWTSWDGGAANRACDLLGQPTDRPIYFASDQNVSPGDYPAISQSLAAQPGPRPKGIYGESGLVDFCLDNRTATVGWLTNATSWSPTPAPNASLRQLYGQSAVPGTDRNIVLKPDWGQWPIEGEPEMPAAPMTMVVPPDVYENEYPDPAKRGKPHPHKGETWLVDGFSAVWVSSPRQLGVYKYLGVGGPTQINAEWFDNLSLLPSSLNMSRHCYPSGSGGGGAGGASADEVARAVLEGLVEHPLKPS